MTRSAIFGPAEQWPAQDLVALSDSFDADLVAEAYRAGVFPMPLPQASFLARMAWWSPMQRGVLPLTSLRVTRSLRQAVKRYRTTVDQAFERVLAGCADPTRPHGWIDAEISEVYTELFHRGIVHSVEAWTPDGRLAGGLYGVSVGGLFAGESMFHDPMIGRDASKVALMALVELLGNDGQDRVIDVQWWTDHLGTLGVIEIDRDEYLTLLDEALELPEVRWPSREPT
ncbi:MAG: leucyl/phenylalanyl-tRNA--protein transferase [Micropruina sp.]|nr:leucyl/phenylalanyl-tRNA--protein transferase [Micropruina sp.]